MNKTLTFILIFITLIVLGQKNPQSIVEEGKLLYKSEMASWYGTDLFLENFKDRDKVGGYFSYSENGIAKCVFFSKSSEPKVIGTISFDSTYDTRIAKIDLLERDFSNNEHDLYEIRKLALTEIQTDTLFKTYNNTDLNLIPLINGNEKKVYVLTGPQQTGVVIFGNDYLLTFDSDNKLLVKKQLHKNIIPIYYGEKVAEGEQVEATIHSHLPETGDFITATDICTLMLYEKTAKWKRHNVVSEKYLNIWDCEKDELNLISMDVIKGTSKNNDFTKI